MDKITFRGQFSGYMPIGEEHAEIKNDKLISYYAKPYCGENSENVGNCVEFKGGELTICDVKSPMGEKYDCIWERVDVDSALEMIAEKTKFTIKKFCCANVNEFTLPAECTGAAADAFQDSPELGGILYFGNKPDIEDVPLYNVYRRFGFEDPYAPKNTKPKDNKYTSKNITREFLSEIRRYPDKYHYVCHKFREQTIKPGVVRIFENGYVIDRFVFRSDTKIIRSGSIIFGKWILIPMKNLEIEDNGIVKDVKIYALSGGTVEEYAKRNGNEFISLDGDVPAECLKYTREGEDMVFRKRVDIQVLGVLNPQFKGEELRAVYGSKNNPLRIGFETVDSKQFAGVLDTRYSCLAAFLIKKGRLKLENCVSTDADIVTCDVVYSQPYKPEYDRWIYICSLFEKDNIFSYLSFYLKPTKGLPFEVCSFDVFCNMPPVGTENKYANEYLSQLDLPECGAFNDAQELYCNKEYRQFFLGLTPVRYTDDNSYCIFRQYMRVRGGKICWDNGGELSGDECEFARFYIDHYRQCFNLPPLILKEV